MTKILEENEQQAADLELAATTFDGFFLGLSVLGIRSQATITTVVGLLDETSKGREYLFRSVVHDLLNQPLDDLTKKRLTESANRIFGYLHGMRKMNRKK